MSFYYCDNTSTFATGLLFEVQSIFENQIHNFMKRPLSIRIGRMLFFPLAFLTLFSTTIFAQVSGTVWQDLPVNGTTLNTYGVKDANELGVEGVTVTVYPGGMTATTAADGTYTVAGASGAVRVEFTWPTLTWAKSSPDAAAQNTSVQFVTAPATGVDFGLHNPADFFDTATPTVYIPTYINGDGQAGGTSASVKSMYYAQYGATTPSGDNAADLNQSLVDNSQTGAIWGVAMDNSKQEMYCAAVLRRHVGVASLGLGGIYKMTDLMGTPAFTPWLNINSLAGINVGTDTRDGSAANMIPADFNQPSWDVLAYQEVGRRGIGDIDLSEDNSILYAINMLNKELIAIDIDPITGAGTLRAGFPVAIPDPGCNMGESRPWALEVHKGKVYVGVVCSAENGGSATDLVGNVYEFDGTSFNTTSVLTVPLNYGRSIVAWGASADWVPWETTAYYGSVNPQPIISDIEIDEKGAMILSIMDRQGMITGVNNYDNSGINMGLDDGQAGGDILRACLVGGAWTLENDANCGGIQTVGNMSPYNEGPGGGEYYWQDGYGTHAVTDDPVDPVGANHRETASGSLVLLPGSNQVMATVMDPVNYDSGGLKLFNSSTGGTDAQFSIYITNAGGSNPPEFMSKAVGLGDIELLGAPAPIEIGNLVWEDTDSDGVQDAGEAGIAGVSVELRKGATLLATATTDANGNYIFSNDPNGADTPSHKYNLSMLVANMEYTLTVPTTNAGNNLTTSNTGEGSNTDLNDSDANTGTGVATVLATDIPVIGANNHTFDFGFSTNACPPARCGTVTAVKN